MNKEIVIKMECCISFIAMVEYKRILVLSMFSKKKIYVLF